MITKVVKNIKTDVSNKFKKIFGNEYLKSGLKWLEIKKIRNANPNVLNYVFFKNRIFWFYNGTEFLHGVHEIFIDETYKIALPQNALIIDCGAHIGLSVFYLKTNFAAASIVAFEPDEKNFEVLKKNIESNNFQNVELRKEAVWIENTYLNFAQKGNMSSKISNNSGNTISVKASRLKEFLNRQVDFLKIDIEGAEYLVMKDIQNELSFVQNLFLEYHGSFENNYQLVELFEILKESNFSFYIKEAHPSYHTPFFRTEKDVMYDVQLNIFCFRI